MQGAAREAREAAHGRSFLDLDVSNCPPTCIIPLFPETNFPTSERYTARVDLWRRAVSEYYAIDMEGAKRILLRALYGYPKPGIDSGATPHVIPLAERIYLGGKRAPDTICEKRPELADLFQHMGRTNPRPTSLFYVMYDKEKRNTDSISALSNQTYNIDGYLSIALFRLSCRFRICDFASRTPRRYTSRSKSTLEDMGAQREPFLTR